MATAAKSETYTFTSFAPAEVAESYIAKARELRPLLRAEAPEGEKLRSPTPAVDKALKDNGLLSLLLPQRWGGAGLSFSDYSRFQIELATGDMPIRADTRREGKQGVRPGRYRWS